MQKRSDENKEGQSNLVNIGVKFHQSCSHVNVLNKQVQKLQRQFKPYCQGNRKNKLGYNIQMKANVMRGSRKTYMKGADICDYKLLEQRRNLLSSDFSSDEEN